MPKDILVVVDEDDKEGGDGDDGYAQTQTVFFLVTFVVSLDAVVDYDDGDCEYYCTS